jgi:hypothetical protein
LSFMATDRNHSISTTSSKLWTKRAKWRGFSAHKGPPSTDIRAEKTAVWHTKELPSHSKSPHNPATLKMASEKAPASRLRYDVTVSSASGASTNVSIREW